MDSALLLTDFSPNEGLDRSSVVELWHVFDILGWTPDNTTSLVYNQTRALGASHLDIGEAICKNIVLRKRWPSSSTTAAPDSERYWEALVAVYFDSSNRETVFNPRSRTVRSYDEIIWQPYWVTVQNPGFDRLCKRRCERTRVRRIETRYARTAQVTPALENVMFSNAGRVYFFGTDSGPIIDPNPSGIPYLYKGPVIDTLSNGLTRLQYVFDTTTPILGMVTGTAQGGVIRPSQPTAALDYLDEWEAPDIGQINGAPIRASRWQDRYVLGGALPYL